MSLFKTTAPLMIHCNEGKKRVIGECFPHPHGVLIFEIFWFEAEEIESKVKLIEGELKGEGPWKIADCIISVVNCRDEEVAIDSSEWQDFITQYGNQYREESHLHQIAQHFGATIL